VGEQLELFVVEPCLPPPPDAPCADCGTPTTPRPAPGRRRVPDQSWEYYVVHHEVWKAAGGVSTSLCIACLERRLITSADFQDVPMNNPSRIDTRRLADRKRRPAPSGSSVLAT
jgi:hypothetical protein